jgi:hypothetical protein
LIRGYAFGPAKNDSTDQLFSTKLRIIPGENQFSFSNYVLKVKRWWNSFWPDSIFEKNQTDPIHLYKFLPFPASMIINNTLDFLSLAKRNHQNLQANGLYYKIYLISCPSIFWSPLRLIVCMSTVQRFKLNTSKLVILKT